MKQIAFYPLISVVFLTFGHITAATANERIDPFDYIDADAPGFAAYAALVERFDAQGHEIIQISNTFLGRLRIVVDSNGTFREIVMSPNTGEIRRDAAISNFQPRGLATASVKSQGKAKGNAGGSGNGNGGGNENGNGNGGGN